MKNIKKRMKTKKKVIEWYTVLFKYERYKSNNKNKFICFATKGKKEKKEMRVIKKEERMKNENRE